MESNGELLFSLSTNVVLKQNAEKSFKTGHLLVCTSLLLFLLLMINAHVRMFTILEIEYGVEFCDRCNGMSSIKVFQGGTSSLKISVVSISPLTLKFLFNIGIIYLFYFGNFRVLIRLLKADEIMIHANFQFSRP